MNDARPSSASPAAADPSTCTSSSRAERIELLREARREGQPVTSPPDEKHAWLAHAAKRSGTMSAIRSAAASRALLEPAEDTLRRVVRDRRRGRGAQPLAQLAVGRDTARIASASASGRPRGRGGRSRRRARPRRRRRSRSRAPAFPPRATRRPCAGSSPSSTRESTRRPPGRARRCAPAAAARGSARAIRGRARRSSPASGPRSIAVAGDQQRDTVHLRERVERDIERLLRREPAGERECRCRSCRTTHGARRAARARGSRGAGFGSTETRAGVDAPGHGELAEPRARREDVRRSPKLGVARTAKRLHLQAAAASLELVDAPADDPATPCALERRIGGELDHVRTPCERRRRAALRPNMPVV